MHPAHATPGAELCCSKRAPAKNFDAGAEVGAGSDQVKRGSSGFLNNDRHDEPMAAGTVDAASNGEKELTVTIQKRIILKAAPKTTQNSGKLKIGGKQWRIKRGKACLQDWLWCLSPRWSCATWPGVRMSKPTTCLEQISASTTHTSG